MYGEWSPEKDVMVTQGALVTLVEIQQYKSKCSPSPSSFTVLVSVTSLILTPLHQLHDAINVLISQEFSEGT